MDKAEREALIARLMAWHEDDEHEKIIDALKGMEDRDYEIHSLYARALNNCERYEEALDILLGLEAEGCGDKLWNFRVGYALYYLNREAEAAEYFKKAIDYGDDSDDARKLFKASIREAERRPEIYSEEEMFFIEAHLEKYFGPCKNVFHETVSPDIHVDIVVIEPSRKHNYYVLVTMGMGAHRMNVPSELEDDDLDRAELLICLPPDWNLQDLTKEEWYWPLRWLKIMARLPLEEDTWLGWGHTVPKGEPFADNTKLSTLMLLNPGSFGEKSYRCLMPDGGTVNFYQMIPLYEEESNFKINTSAQILLNFFDDEALEYVRIDRENVCEG